MHAYATKGCFDSAAMHINSNMQIFMTLMRWADHVYEVCFTMLNHVPPSFRGWEMHLSTTHLSIYLPFLLMCSVLSTSTNRTSIIDWAQDHIFNLFLSHPPFLLFPHILPLHFIQRFHISNCENSEHWKRSFQGTFLHLLGEVSNTVVTFLFKRQTQPLQPPWPFSPFERATINICVSLVLKRSDALQTAAVDLLHKSKTELRSNGKSGAIMW